MDVRAAITAALSQSDIVVNVYLEDLKPDELLVRPAPKANHIAWQLGHLIASERYLVIAAPDRQELYEYFKRKLGRAAGIEVVRERRAADRRTPATTPPPDRRRQNRRARPGLDAELRAFGFAIVIRD